MCSDKASSGFQWWHLQRACSSRAVACCVVRVLVTSLRGWCAGGLVDGGGCVRGVLPRAWSHGSRVARARQQPAPLVPADMQALASAHHRVCCCMVCWQMRAAAPRKQLWAELEHRRCGTTRVATACCWCWGCAHWPAATTARGRLRLRHAVKTLD